jgi:transposase InsO family protein
MVIDMNVSKLRSIEQIRHFLAGTLDVQFLPQSADPRARDLARYGLISEVIRRFNYPLLRRPDKSLILRFLQRISGYSAVQVKRLVGQVVADPGRALVKRYKAPTAAFSSRFTPTDVLLLAKVDRAHGCLSGPATAHLLERAFSVFGDARYASLATISVSHLYNLRHDDLYLRQRVAFTKTKPVVSTIGIRRKPDPKGRPGYIRIDSVHQGDLDGVKGVYYINAVDCVTQWEVVACTEKISEAYLLSVFETMLAAFPFRISGFHSDNGSEYINHTVAALLEKLNIEQSKSRPRHSNDNGLAESKNAAVVRKTFGYSHIPQRFAPTINAFCNAHLNPYVNFHRPCLFAVETINKKGKCTKTYPHNLVATPLEKLAIVLETTSKQIRILRTGITLADLQHQALATSDFEAAVAMNRARDKLFQSFNRRAA